jgi:hypothetical protein
MTLIAAMASSPEEAWVPISRATGGRRALIYSFIESGTKMTRLNKLKAHMEIR